MIELVEKYIKTTITALYMFKKLEEMLNMLSRDMEDIKKIKTELLEKTAIMSEMKKFTAWINRLL